MACFFPVFEADRENSRNRYNICDALRCIVYRLQCSFPFLNCRGQEHPGGGVFPFSFDFPVGRRLTPRRTGGFFQEYSFAALTGVSVSPAFLVLFFRGKY